MQEVARTQQDVHRKMRGQEAHLTVKSVKEVSN